MWWEMQLCFSLAEACAQAAPRAAPTPSPMALVANSNTFLASSACSLQPSAVYKFQARFQWLFQAQEGFLGSNNIIFGASRMIFLTHPSHVGQMVLQNILPDENCCL